VQSPSRDSHEHDDGDDTTTTHTTPVHNNSSPLEYSPSHPSSTGRHSRISSSSATRFSGTLRSSSPGSCCRGAAAAAGGRKRGLAAKGWREVAAAIDEEGAHDEIDEEPAELPRCCVAAFWVSVLVLASTVTCLAVWGAARRYKPIVVVQVHRFFI
jgi:hypothetical protein